MAIIGLVGPFGSGCTYVAKEILGKELGYQYLSLSDILREEYQTMKGTDSEKPDRSALQDFGDTIRESKGADYLARKVSQRIDILAGDFVVDSIRNPEEVNFLKGQYVDFFVIGVFAGSNLRWERVKDSYDGNWALFLKDEERDKGEKIAHGQRVTDAFLTSDAIVLNEAPIVNRNEAYKTLKAKIEKYIHLFKGEALDKTPSEKESVMAMAYSNSLRSSCLKRKVGAVIIDSKGSVFSSGYNEVPFLERPCLSEYGDCYRSVSKKGIEDLFKDGQEVLRKKVMKQVKLLEKCRALHAEENAILNVARFGSTVALEGATLYTTTYPCNLCANKIAQVGGIRKVVYYEPYPVKEAKETLEKAGIQQEMFEGITFNAYFRVFNEIIL